MATAPAKPSAALDRPNPLLFRVAFARARPCYVYGCICLTRAEARYERRVFRLARVWSKALKREQVRLERERARSPAS